MRILSVERHDVKQLISKLRKVTLFKDRRIKPYRNALITLEYMNVDTLSPTQNYVLRSELQKVKNLYKELKGFEIDLFNLNGYVTIYLEESDEPVDVLPVIVEESIESDGWLHAIINDGMHRISLAGALGIVPQVVYIRGIDTKKYPYYAYPLEDGWFSDIQILDSLPKNYVKKKYRYPDNHKWYFRNFNSQFKNTQGPRKREGEK